jgi:phosphatidate cytidylyltransferase
MSDDSWGRGDHEPDPFDAVDDEFGEVHFADDEPTQAVNWVGGTTPPSTPDATTAVPSWSAADTGEVTRPRRNDDTGVWSALSSDDEDDPFLGEEFPVAPTTAAPRRRSETPPASEVWAEVDASRPSPGRSSGRARGTGRSVGSGRPAARSPRPGATGPAVGSKLGRDMPTAVGMGLAIAALFVLLEVLGKPWMMAALVTLVMSLGAVEFFEKTTERGYRPPAVIGIAAIAAAPLAAYAFGEQGVVLVLALAFIGTALSFVLAPGLDSGPMPNMAVTSLGVVYLGLLGSFGGLILAGGGGGHRAGTDTLFLVAVGVVASDVGALFVGAAIGRTPLRAWISPNKTLEGFIGGLLGSLVAVSLVATRNGTWNGKVNVAVLGLGIGLLAPLGDLTESMFKRNLDIKDFGTVVRGHGGVLDRFDGFLFALPFAYYALIVLQPWTLAGK